MKSALDGASTPFLPLRPTNRTPPRRMPARGMPTRHPASSTTHEQTRIDASPGGHAEQSVVKVRRGTETNDAPREQGATTENTACI